MEREVKISDIIVGERIWDLKEESIAVLEEGLRESPLANPITLRKDGKSLILVAGAHRLEAFKRLGRPTIPATIHTNMTKAEARVLEAQENLLRRTPTEAEERRLYEAAFGAAVEETDGKGFPSVSSLNDGRKAGPQHQPSPVSKVAKTLGVSRPTARKKLKEYGLHDGSKPKVAASLSDDPELTEAPPTEAITEELTEDEIAAAEKGRALVEAVRRGMAMEGTVAEVAKAVGVPGLTKYRAVRDILLLADRGDLLDRDKEAVESSLQLILAGGSAEEAKSSIEYIVHRMWGADARVPRDQAEKRVKESYLTDLQILLESAERLESTVIPYFARDEMEEEVLRMAEKAKKHMEKIVANLKGNM